MNRTVWIILGLILALFIVWYAARDTNTGTIASPSPTYTVTALPTDTPTFSPVPSGTVGNRSSLYSVPIQNFSFGSVVTVKKGDVVVYKNMDSVLHTVTAINGAFDSGTLNPGEQFSLSTATLTKGTYTLKCNFHPYMRGTLIVR